VIEKHVGERRSRTFHGGCTPTGAGNGGGNHGGVGLQSKVDKKESAIHKYENRKW